MVKNKENDVIKKKCKFCGKLFIPKRSWQDYCNPKEQKEYHRRVQSDKMFLLRKIERLEKEFAKKYEQKSDLKGLKKS